MINPYFWTLRRWLVVAACVLSMAPPTFSQTRTQESTSLDALLRQSQAILIQIDTQDAAAVWAGASAIMRESSKKDEFVAQTARDRMRLGSISSRMWQSIVYTSYADGNVQQIPSGEYVNLNFIVLGASGQALKESISFRFEEGRWLMTGYISQRVD
ncbi:MAG: DUF4019 domain-containing protein [Janthinobacterium lividum]